MNLLRRIYSPFVKIAAIANATGTLVIFLLVAMMNADVFSRNFLNAPLHGVLELVVFSLIFIVFFQLPDVVRNNRLTRSDGFLGLMETSSPRFANGLARVIDLAAAIFMGLIAWTVWPEFTESIETCHFVTPPDFGPPPTGNLWTDFSSAWARCDYFGTPGVFTAPWWPAKLAIFFGIAMCCIIFLFKVVLGNRNPTMVDKGESPV
jgi:TRAP-type C4-dicarboxylate transport system permease small subunit